MSQLHRPSAMTISLMLIALLLLSGCGTAAPTSAPATQPPATVAPTTTAPAATTGQATATPPQATEAAIPPAVTAKNPNTLIEATIGDAESLDPAWAYDTASGEVIFNVYETLVFLKRDKVDQFVPMLATRWDISQDGKTYTFTIRKGVKFQEGQDLTPEDVAYSLWRGMIQDRAGGPQWIMLQPFFGLDVQSFKDDVVGKQYNNDWTKACEAVKQAVTYDNDAGTVTMHLKQPYGPMLQILTGSWASIVSKPWVVQQGGWNGDCATAEKYHDPTAEKDALFKVMNGTGPYKLDRWAPGEEIDLVRNDTYWLKEPLWDGGLSGPASAERAVIKIISEWGTRFATFKAGDADIAYVDRQYISQVDPLVKETCDYQTGKCTTTHPNGSLRLYKGLPTVEAVTAFFNQNVNTTGGNNALGSGKLDGNGIPADFFNDIHIRKAFNACFDWDTYIKQVWNGEAEQALGPIIDGELGYDPNQAHYSFDLTRCADEFKASTLKSPDGKSLWDAGFYLQYVYNTGNDQRRTAGEILKDSLAKVNPKFHLSVVDEPWPVFLKDQTDSRLPLFMLGWLEDFHDPQDWVTPYLVSGGTYGGTQHFPQDLQTQMDTLIKQGVQTSDSQARTKIYEQLQNLAYENALDIFVVQPQGRHYEQTWVKGWYYNPTYPGIYFYALSKGS
ncbi:MAG TPA: peptide ABC transporter substrate-binding protein [Chloroflexi bacterium]|nr:peptide ABC transporter substrate-binding protein [Chloroflexota bacterium]